MAGTQSRHSETEGVGTVTTARQAQPSTTQFTGDWFCLLLNLSLLHNQEAKHSKEMVPNSLDFFFIWKREERVRSYI